MPPLRQHTPELCAWPGETIPSKPSTADPGPLVAAKQGKSRLTFLSRSPRKNTLASPNLLGATDPLSLAIQPT